jgi:hypothetical protein
MPGLYPTPSKKTYTLDDMTISIDFFGNDLTPSLKEMRDDVDNTAVENKF